MTLGTVKRFVNRFRKGKTDGVSKIMSSMNKVLTVLLLGAMSLQCYLPGYAKNCSKRVMRTKASFYGEHFAGKKTASGAIFNPNGMTAGIVSIVVEI